MMQYSSVWRILQVTQQLVTSSHGNGGCDCVRRCFVMMKQHNLTQLFPAFYVSVTDRCRRHCVFELSASVSPSVRQSVHSPTYYRLLRYLHDVITVLLSRSTQSSALVRPILFSSHQMIPVSRSQTALSSCAAPHLWNRLSPTLRVPYHFDPS